MFFLETILHDTTSQHSSSPLKQDICNICRKAVEYYKDIEHGDIYNISKLRKQVVTISAEAIRINTQCSTELNQDLLQSNHQVLTIEDHAFYIIL